jgi:hypothetical protein
MNKSTAPTAMDDLSPFAKQLLRECEGIPIPKIIDILCTVGTYAYDEFDEIMKVVSELEKL